MADMTTALCILVIFAIIAEFFFVRISCEVEHMRDDIKAISKMIEELVSNKAKENKNEN